MTIIDIDRRMIRVYVEGKTLTYSIMYHPDANQFSFYPGATPQEFFRICRNASDVFHIFGVQLIVALLLSIYANY
jgi:hypothetical protein